ncbi:MAG: NADP-dependent oxidoreductase [Pseudomonadota bacterium]|nr:NADP-dependent oxidoreductase [Pseudomonadota bacterium]
MKYHNSRFLLNKRPKGMPEDDCWVLDNETITDLNHNEILIQSEYLSIDPYMRGKMNDGLSYTPPLKIGEVMVGESVGRVIESKSNKFKIGDLVTVHQGWQTFIRAKDSDPSIFKVPESKLQSSVFLGAIGMPGRTAYYGLNYVGKPKAGETLVVSAASGAVGSVVGQLGKLLGCKVIGIAGGLEKAHYVVDELGFDQCIDYKNQDVAAKLREYCPEGIDVYFENVGGEITKDVSKSLNKGARVPICGFISKYNSPDIASEETPFHVLGALKPKPRHRFFVVTEWLNQFEKTTAILHEYIKSGDIKYKETITSGFENAPQALRDVLSGKNFGKQIIKI